MYKIKQYYSDDMMSDLICNYYPMLLVMGRFNIDMGVGDESIEEVCSRNGVDTYTLLAVVNTLLAAKKEHTNIECAKLSLTQLTEYLHNSHAYFLDYRLPLIRRELVEALSGSDSAVSIVIVNYYDEYFAEVRKHMMYEENRLFPYIESILSGSTSDFSSEIYSKNHDKVEAKLAELKNIIIKYYPTKSTNELTNTLYDIFTCEQDLTSHTVIEDHLLVPAIKTLEGSNAK